ncbi:MAG: hypothetical protein ACKO1W_16465, partial [Microcystaceae cyanobacterium]
MNALATLSPNPKTQATSVVVPPELVPVSVTSPAEREKLLGQPLTELQDKTWDIELPSWLQDCLEEVGAGHPSEAECLICRAFRFAYQLHEGQYRKSGEA